MRRALVAAFGMIFMAAAASANEPPVPPGLSVSGAVMVALVGPGVDYRLPELQASLARDGEGDLIGWDFSDADNKPFAEGGAGTDAARTVANITAAAQLVVVKERPGDPQAFGHMMTMVGNTPARIIVWLDADPKRSDWPILAQAIRRFGDRLFIIGTVDRAELIAKSPSYLGVRESANVLLITSRDTTAALPITPAPAISAITIAPDSRAMLSAHHKAAVIASALAARAFLNDGRLSVAGVKNLVEKAASTGIAYDGAGLSLAGSEPAFVVK